MAENPDDVLHVEGGKPLNGTIKVRGAKNFVSKAMVAALLAPCLLYTSDAADEL